MTTTNEDFFVVLRERMRGRVVTPADPDYDAERMPWNLAVDQRPAAIAFPEDVEDLGLVVRAAADAGLSVMAQPNGHAAHERLDGTVLLKLSRFDEVSIDRDARSARVGGGVNWGRVLPLLAGSGLAAIAGSNPEVSVVGYSVAGGHSLFSRAFGLAAGSITAVELVDAEGTFRRVTEENDSELLWALRGAGGLFGVITTIEFELYEAASLFGGKLMFPIECAAALLAEVFAVATDNPAVGLSFSAMNFPDLPDVPEPLRGRTVASVDLLLAGQTDNGEAILKRFRDVGQPIMESVQTFDIGSLAAVAAEPVDPMPFVDWSGVASGFDATSARELMDAFSSASSRGLARLEVRPLSGAIAQAPRNPSVAGPVTAAAILSGTVMLMDPSMAASANEAFEPLDAAIATVPAHGIIATFLAGDSTLADAYDGEKLERLAAVKNRMDPNAVIKATRELPSR